MLQRRARQLPDPALAALLRRLREDRGITQEALAAGAGVTMSALSRIERGLNSPGWETVKRIVLVLGVSLVELAAQLETPPARTAPHPVSAPRRQTPP
jgi:transcriptional regulator with XRE-family HTH domain